MAVSMEMIKELKDKTGAGIVDCKKTLEETGGDMDKSVEILRKKGMAKADKKAGREAKEGTILLRVSPDNKKGVVVKINCETDFVAKTDNFQRFAGEVADLIFSKGYKFTGELPADVEDLRKGAIAILGENILVSEWAWIENASWLYGYVHRDKYGVKVVAMIDFKASAHVADDAESEEFMKNIAMQVTSMDPAAVNKESIPQDLLAKEKEIYAEEAKASGKPAAVIEKIIEGKLKKFYEENVLLEQTFVFDEEKKIKDLIADYSKAKNVTVSVESFVRIAI